MSEDRFKDVPWGSYRDAEPEIRRHKNAKRPEQKPRRNGSFLRRGNRINRASTD